MKQNLKIQFSLLHDNTHLGYDYVETNLSADEIKEFNLLTFEQKFEFLKVYVPEGAEIEGWEHPVKEENEE